MGKLMRALGLMSGTSLDGIDVALLETDGESQVVRGPAMTFAYTDAMRNLLRNAIADALSVTGRNDRPGCLPEADREITEQHAAAVSAFLRNQNIAHATLDVIGFHGQTVLHRPEQHMTLQLGLGDMLASLTRCRVVYDLRAADVEAGGQGAPLVPVYHQALTAHLKQRPLAVVNIGGIANVTYIGRDGRLLAFDTGPGNALIDDWMITKAGLPRDDNGAAAAKGNAQDEIVRFYLNHSYFAAPPPKSLDRQAFAGDMVHGLSLEDGAATLTALSAAAIAKAREHMPEEPELWIVCGGGRLNRTLMSMIAGRVHHAVVPAEAAGLNGDSLEAEAWAYLAVRSLRGLPITFPGTTGASEPLTGGVIAEPQTYLVN